MKNSLKYIKNIFKVLIWPIIFMVGQFFIQYIFVAIFNSKERGTLTEKEFLKHIKTEEYISNIVLPKSFLLGIGRCVMS